MGGLYFLFLGLGAQGILIDLKGNVVHEWTIDWRAIWADPRDRRSGVATLHTVVTRVFLQPNGDVFALFTGEGGLLGDCSLTPSSIKIPS